MTQLLCAATATEALAYVSDPLLQRLVPTALEAGTASYDEAVSVSVNHGRWVVECPDNDVCRPGYGAQLASETDRRFMCHDCLNASLNGRWRPVVWPADVAAVEADLARVPVEQRNWTPPAPGLVTGLIVEEG